MELDRFERPPTAQIAVLTELRRRIIQGELAPGQPIRQEALASDLGVSRLPVREALMVLQAEQLVSYVQHRGYVATALDRDDLVQTYRLRELLETEAVKTAVRNLTDDDLKVMEGAATRMEGLSQSDTKDFVLENRLFHFTLFEGSANPRLVKLLRQLWDACDRYRVMYIAQPEARARVHAEHRGGGLSSVLRVFEAQTQPGPEQTRTRAARRAKK
jgi:DNA-binding GntR family transcriptional regulator